MDQIKCTSNTFFVCFDDSSANSKREFILNAVYKLNYIHLPDNELKIEMQKYKSNRDLIRNFRIQNSIYRITNTQLTIEKIQVEFSTIILDNKNNEFSLIIIPVKEYYK